jgi:nucleoside-diphosphate-sugar epimerase
VSGLKAPAEMTMDLIERKPKRATQWRLSDAVGRSLEREAGVRAMLDGAGANSSDKLSFFAANLERDEGWAEAMASCGVASPMPPTAPKTEDEVIVPAREGTLLVLRAARDAKVKRVVMTSTCGAVYYGHPLQEAPFDEASTSAWSTFATLPTCISRR